MYVSWSAPLVPRGPVDYYEVKMELSDGTESKPPQYFRKQVNILEILTPECTTSSMYYKVYVRAVNVGANGTMFYGPWSPPAGDNCYIQNTGKSINYSFFQAIKFIDLARTMQVNSSPVTWARNPNLR